MIGFIKKLFSGILSFLVGLFKGKKSQEDLSNSKPAELLEKSAELISKPKEILGKAATQAATKVKKSKDFFLELDEAEEKQSTNGNQSAKAESAKAEPAKKTEVGVATKSAKADAKTTEATAKPQPVKADAKTTEATAKPQPVKAESTKATEATANNKATNVELVQTAEGVKVEQAKPVKVPTTTANSETTFAPKYLIPSNSNTRRRPGPNMSTFLDMARQVKTPG